MGAAKELGPLFQFDCIESIEVHLQPSIDGDVTIVQPTKLKDRHLEK